MYATFHGGGVEIGLIFYPMASGFRDMRLFFNLICVGMNLGNWQKFQKLQIHVYYLSTSIHVMGSFSLHGQQFLRYDFQNCHVWAWNVGSSKSSRSCAYTLFLPHGIGIIAYFHTAVSEIRADFQNCHIWAWNLTSGKSSRSCTYTLSTPGGRNSSYFRSTGHCYPNGANFDLN